MSASSALASPSTIRSSPGGRCGTSPIRSLGNSPLERIRRWSGRISSPIRSRQSCSTAKQVRQNVKELAALARAGAYLARDRRVSPKERTRWRFTYRDHFTQSFAALSAGSGEEVRPAIEAVSTLITVACETAGFDYFRSEDPIEASKVVISEMVDQLWAGIG